MTMVDDTWTPEVHTPPGQAPSPPMQAERRGEALYLAIAEKFDHTQDPVEHYQQLVYWRSVLEQAAMEMTVHAGYALLELQTSGLSSRKIAALLTESGCPLSPSGVEAAITRAKNAR